MFTIDTSTCLHSHVLRQYRNIAHRKEIYFEENKMKKRAVK